MNHYCYLLTFPDGMRYVGARSTKLSPELDTTYLGSGKYLPKDRHEHRDTVTKVILATFDTREALLEYETTYILSNNCVQDTSWYNRRRSTHDRHGCIAWNKGKSTDTTKSAITLKRRYGNGFRTPAQIAGAASMREKLTGVKNPAKGRAGIKNNGFKPWYSISPEGIYTEHLEMTKQEFTESLGVTQRQMIHRFHYTNEHKEAKTKPLKGWTFGNLPKPSN